MKPNIHPQYYPEAKVKCACGNVITVGATKQEIQIEICSHCHPFYTGKQGLIDTAGRAERFNVRAARTVAVRKKSEKKTAKAQKKAKKTATAVEVKVKPQPKTHVTKEARRINQEMKTNALPLVQKQKP